MNKVLFALVASVLLGGCATLNGGSAVAQCGNPCAAISCPSAFFCQVDGNCIARCQAESFKPGI
jgi:hypothetical protein